MTLIILAVAAKLVDPRKRPLHHPTLRQNQFPPSLTFLTKIPFEDTFSGCFA